MLITTILLSHQKQKNKNQLLLTREGVNTYRAALYQLYQFNYFINFTIITRYHLNNAACVLLEHTIHNATLLAQQRILHIIPRHMEFTTQ